MRELLGREFIVTVEVVTPAGTDPVPLLDSLRRLDGLPFHGFSVATNPVARPRMDALAFCTLIRATLDRPAILHCTTRDHNRLALRSILWGARAVGIDTILAATGDMVAHAERGTTTTVGDADVYDLLAMAGEIGLTAGAVLTDHEDDQRLEKEIGRLEGKVRAGAAYAVTQPLFTEQSARRLAAALGSIDIPVLMGILPLRTARHGRFLRDRVSGINVPTPVIERVEGAVDGPGEGALMARDMLEAARELFAGACLMPPFDHYEILEPILGRKSAG